jgi:hypothetical protein
MVAAAAVAAACAPGRAPQPPAPVIKWPVVTHEHVDLWLHGYALLMRDAAKVPVFRRGYRDSINLVRRRANVLTGLDVNHDKLATLMVQNPEITNGQFLPLYFDSWDEMSQAIGAFVRADGAPGRAAPAIRQQFAIIGSMYPTAQDREWLRLFNQSLGDEYDHFYNQYWTAQQQDRRGVVEAVDSLWNNVRQRFQRFLTSTQQTGGELALSLVLGGEGRTLNAAPDHNELVVTMPPTRAQAAEAIYGFAHEAVQNISNAAVNDNTTPAEQRSGAAAGYTPLAAVRGGAMLLERVAPELVDGYMRFYLRQAGVTPPAGNVEPTFVGTFLLPTAVAADMSRLIGNALGGI